MECRATVVKFDYEYLLRIKANVDVRRSIMRVAYTKTIFCLRNKEHCTRFYILQD